jgi:DNA polymerase I-like protein with 3'-5' exonuclease and polymerase domains
VLAADPSVRLSFDIETPGKDEDEGTVDDISYRIDRIGFSYRGYEALSIPWAPPYMAAIHTLLSSPGEKVVWNKDFDVPRIEAAGVPIPGRIHDAMVAWHILHSDLPKGLGFVATFTCPWQPAWKHLSHAKPAFYNATDSDVEGRSMEVIERDLRAEGLWSVYERDVLDLDPILVHMHTAGMPVDAEVRDVYADELELRRRRVLDDLEAHVPHAARAIAQVYKSTPKDTTGLHTRPGVRVVPTCTGCGLERPGKSHFKTFKRKLNPCAALGTVPTEHTVVEYYRLAAFTPSRHQLIRYQHAVGRLVPTKWDKSKGARTATMDEKAIADLLRRFPDDPVYAQVLQYRELQKIQGTYIGYPHGPSRT